MRTAAEILKKHTGGKNIFDSDVDLTELAAFRNAIIAAMEEYAAEVVRSKDSGSGTSTPDSDYDRKIGPMSKWGTKGGYGLEPDDPWDEGGFKHFQD